MSDRLPAIRSMSSLGAKAAFSALVIASLAVAACGTTNSGGGGGSTNASLEACKVAASDLAPTVTTTGTATATAGLTGQKLSADGSSALQPLVKQAAAEFDKANGTISTINAGGSGQGLKDVAAGAVQIGNSDVFAAQKLTPAAAATLTDHQVGAVIFTLVVSNDLNGKVNNLTTQEITDIFTGVDTNWSQIGGPSETITVVNRPTTSGTRSTFDKYVLKGVKETAGTDLTQDNTGAVAQAVSQTPGSIGYVSIGFAASSQFNTLLTPICIDGFKGVAADVNSGSYNFWGIEHMYTKGPATGAAKALITYIQSSQVQSNDLLALSYLPVSAISASAITAHTPANSPAPESFYAA
jgi:phosphate transport system substrate-binding protein